MQRGKRLGSLNSFLHAHLLCLGPILFPCSLYFLHSWKLFSNYCGAGMGWQEYIEELYKRELHDPDNHDGVITHLEPDILECEVKWALESILRTKLVEVMESQRSYFKSWKMMLWKCCTQYASKFGKLSSGHRTGKGRFSLQSLRKAMLKNAQTTTHLHSSHTLVK